MLDTKAHPENKRYPIQGKQQRMRFGMDKVFIGLEMEVREAMAVDRRKDFCSQERCQNAASACGVTGSAD